MILTFPILLLLAASDKLPPANPLPPPAMEDPAVMAPVDALFAAIAARDATAAAAILRPEAGATIAAEAPDGARSLTHLDRTALIARIANPGPDRLEERLYNPVMEADGDVAMVWGRYGFFIAGKLHHCGYDHFDLVREGGTWKIAYISWSSRITGCAEPTP
jgi:hypothetical protein